MKKYQSGVEATLDVIGVLDFFCYWGEAHLERVYGDKSLALEGPFMSEEEMLQIASGAGLKRD